MPRPYQAILSLENLILPPILYGRQALAHARDRGSGRKCRYGTWVAGAHRRRPTPSPSRSRTRCHTPTPPPWVFPEGASQPPPRKRSPGYPCNN
eukprot:249251-Prorocentrum_minimum.AAC.1